MNPCTNDIDTSFLLPSITDTEEGVGRDYIEVFSEMLDTLVNSKDLLTSEPEESVLLLDMTDNEFLTYLISLNLARDPRTWLVEKRNQILLKKQERLIEVEQIRSSHIEKCWLYSTVEMISEVNTDLDNCVATLNRMAEELLQKMISKKYKENNALKQKQIPADKRDVLYQWFIDHLDSPYPTKKDKMELSSQTGLEQKQINSWFINMRHRHWKPLLMKREQSNQTLSTLNNQLQD